jgi:hypothetical protein
VGIDRLKGNNKIRKTPWRKGSASDSSPEGCAFKSRRGHLVLSLCCILRYICFIGFVYLLSTLTVFRRPLGKTTAALVNANSRLLSKVHRVPADFSPQRQLGSQAPRRTPQLSSLTDPRHRSSRRNRHRSSSFTIFGA